MGVKISELTSATSLTGSEELPIVQAGNTKKATINQVKAQNYSTTEQVVGTWIDGKPLYEQTITTTAPSVTSDGTDVTKSIEIANTIDFAFIPFQIAYASLQCFTLPYVVVATPLRRMTCRVDRSSSTNMTYISILSNGTGFNGTTVVATIRYTKTTDTATRGGEQLRSMNTGSLVGSGEKSNLLLDELESGDKEEVKEDTTEEVQENKEAEGSGDDGQLR